MAISLVSRSLEPPTLGVVFDGRLKERGFAGAPLRTILLLPLAARMDIDGVIIMFIDSGPVSRALPDRPEPRPVDRCSGSGRGGVSVYMRSRKTWGKKSSHLRWLKYDGARTTMRIRHA